MKFRLIALAACCAFAGSTVALSGSSAPQSPQLADLDGVHPPQLADLDGVHPPQLATDQGLRSPRFALRA